MMLHVPPNATALSMSAPVAQGPFRLGTVVARQSRAATTAYIKNPKAPMPKLYPDLLNDQSISDVTEYLYQQWGKHD